MNKNRIAKILLGAMAFVGTITLRKVRTSP